MQGFKGLLPRHILNDDAFAPIFAKAEENQKAAQVCNDFFLLINRFFESFTQVIEKCILDGDVGNLNASFYRLIGFVCSRLLKENKQLTENTKISSRELTKICNAILEDFSKFIQGFQTNVRKYVENEHILQELSKKYYRSHKNMISSMESYKNSFTDVTLIYNMDEKNKRYQTCENNYNAIVAEYKTICEKVELLNERKASICKNYEDLQEEFSKVIRMIGSRVISETKNFVGYYSQANKSISTFLAEQKFNLEKEKLKTFFASIEDCTKRECFSDDMPPQNENSIIPLIFEYPEYIRDEYLETYNMEMLNYLKKVEEFAEKRKSENKRINELFSNYFKSLEKNHIQGVKEIIQNFDKLKKKLTESFGPRLASFIKSINAIFELLSGIDEKMVKNINVKLSQNQIFINEESKLLKLFIDELRSNIEKFIGKKELKRLREEEFTEEATMVNIPSFRKDVNQKAMFLKHLITGFNDKMEKNSEKISKIYTEILHDMGESTNEFYSLCCEYQELYFGPEEFQKNFKKYEDDVNSLLEKNKDFFESLPFSVVKTENTKIVFDGDFNKVEDFKKLKKPAPIENLSSNSKENGKEEEQKSNVKESSDKNEELVMKRTESAGNLSSPDHNNGPELTNSRKMSAKDYTYVEEKEIKNLEFLLTKIQMKENETYLKSFSCALSEKIILQGRIYITSERICFSSGFNSNNLFFGKTFLQFPKEDITKIEKRLNAVFMDNAISFTTVKGELFFTSFFSRDEAYDLVCKTFGFNLDEHVYDFDEATEKEIPEAIVDIQEDDDIKDDELQSRKEAIEPLLDSFAYSDFATYEMTKEGMNAYLLFKIFYSDSELTINRRKYKNFLLYYKELINHKDLQIAEWQPSLETIMNKSNIKSSAPLFSERKILATVPVANSGVPFMPKHASSEEKQKLFFISKKHWILISEISTWGAPYTDTFKVLLKTVCISENDGKCRIEMKGGVHFVKSTMMKSVIENKSTEESAKSAKIWIEEIKKYFAALDKANKKKSKEPGNELESLKQELEEKTTEYDCLLVEKQNLEKEVEELKTKNTKSNKIIMYLGVLCFILFLIILK